MICPCCQQSLDEFEQPALLPHLPARRMVVCRTEGCALELVLAGHDDFAELVAASRDGYARARAHEQTARVLP